MEIATTMEWITVIGSVGVIVSSLEFLAMGREFSPGGLFDWTVTRQGYSTSALRILDRFFGHPAFWYWLAVRLIAACALVTGQITGWANTALLLLITFISMAVNIRIPFGLEGAEQMTVIVFSILGLASFFPGDANVQKACMWFLTCQCCLAYITAGIAKYRTAGWREGVFLSAILKTRSYGQPWLARLAARPNYARVLSAGIIGFQCLFVIVLFSAKSVVLPLLIAGVLFHAFNAYAMGLNIFFWAFLATYPAIWYCRS